MIKRTTEELSALAHKVEHDAKKVAEDLENCRLTSTKMRKFYSEFKRLERIWDNGGRKPEKFLEILPMIKLVISKVSYDSQRSGNRMPQQASVFFKDELTKIKTDKDFDTFMLFLEAIVGYANLRN